MVGDELQGAQAHRRRVAMREHIVRREDAHRAIRAQPVDVDSRPAVDTHDATIHKFAEQRRRRGRSLGGVDADPGDLAIVDVPCQTRKRLTDRHDALSRRGLKVTFGRDSERDQSRVLGQHVGGAHQPQRRERVSTGKARPSARDDIRRDGIDLGIAQRVVCQITGSEPPLADRQEVLRRAEDPQAQPLARSHSLGQPHCTPEPATKEDRTQLFGFRFGQLVA